MAKVAKSRQNFPYFFGSVHGPCTDLRAYFVQNQWSKQVMENPYSPSCVQVGPGPHIQTLESKPRLGKLTVFCVLVKVHLQILCKIGSQNKAWESCVPSCAQIQVLALIQRCALHKTLWPKNKDWKTYSVSCVLVKVHALIQRCALHKILSPKKKKKKDEKLT